jgi:hypothetical protein
MDKNLYDQMIAANATRQAELDKEHENSVVDEEDRVS